MKMVAAAKLRRAQEAVLRGRKYGENLENLIGRALLQSQGYHHPLMRKSDEVKKIALLVMSSDRGLCGGFNSNLLRKVNAFLVDKSREGQIVEMTVIGRKGNDFFKAKKQTVKKPLPNFCNPLTYEQVKDLVLDLSQEFIQSNYDELHIAYNYFRSAGSQEIVIKKILPLSKPELGEPELKKVIWEPDEKSLLDSLIPKNLITQVFQALLDSTASEFASRMQAMESASNNASDMIEQLTLQMNRARQAMITNELMDIVNGAEAMK